jgi:hypothetical protein
MTCKGSISVIPQKAFYTLENKDIYNLGIGETYSGVAGCLQEGPNVNILAKSLNFNPDPFNTGEFEFTLGENCTICSHCWGAECAKGIAGKRPSIKRIKFNADPAACCSASDPIVNGRTCDPKYRAGNTNREKNCNEHFLKLCEYDNNKAGCHKAFPTAVKKLLDYGKCSKECDGGNRSRKCEVVPDVSHFSDYYITNDECSGLEMSEDCNQFECEKSNWYIYLFIIVCCFLAGGMVFAFKIGNRKDP